MVTLQNPESIELVGIGDNLSRQSFPWARANDKVARVNGCVQEPASERASPEGCRGRTGRGWKGGASPLLHYSKPVPCLNQSWHICLMPTVNRIKEGLICLMLIVLQFLHMSTFFNKETPNAAVQLPFSGRGCQRVHRASQVGLGSDVLRLWQ